MNPELYERYLAKKAKKLGISVEELKAQGTSSPVKEAATTQNSQFVQSSPTSNMQNFSSISTNSAQSNFQQNIEYSQPTSSISQVQPGQQSYSQPAQPQYIQQTIQEHLAQQPDTQKQVQSQVQQFAQPQVIAEPQIEEPKSQPYMGMQKETVKTEVPSYIFGPSKMTEPPKYSSSPINQPKKPEIPDNRENKFGLIGYPLGHSLSKVIHEAGFKSLGVKATYDILETPPDTLVDRVKFLKGNGYKGFNVTIPLKLPISLFVN